MSLQVQGHSTQGHESPTQLYCISQSEDSIERSDQSEGRTQHRNIRDVFSDIRDENVDPD